MQPLFIRSWRKHVSQGIQPVTYNNFISEINLWIVFLLISVFSKIFTLCTLYGFTLLRKTIHLHQDKELRTKRAGWEAAEKGRNTMVPRRWRSTGAPFEHRWLGGARIWGDILEAGAVNTAGPVPYHPKVNTLVTTLRHKKYGARSYQNLHLGWVQDTFRPRPGKSQSPWSFLFAKGFLHSLALSAWEDTKETSHKHCASGGAIGRSVHSAFRQSTPPGNFFSSFSWKIRSLYVSSET